MVGDVLGQGEGHRDAGLVVEMAGNDEAVVGELGAGHQSDEVADLDSQLTQIVG